MSYIQLNIQQAYALQQMKMGYNCFLTGPGGVGKSFIIDIFVKWVKIKYKSNPKAVAVTSTTGISALLINGITLHSFAGVGFGEESVNILLKKINKKYATKMRWKFIKVLVIDEISMLNPILFKKIEKIARVMKGNDIPFGGIQIILSGDFAQLPAVKSLKFCFETSKWNKCIDKTLYLTEIVRQKNKIFQQCLNEIRLGKVTSQTIDILKSRVGVKLKNDYNIEPTRLYSLKHHVNIINNDRLQILINEDNVHKTYKSKTKVVKNLKNLNEKYLKSMMDKNCQCVDNLTISVGSQVMIIANNLTEKIVNGSRGIVTEFIGESPKVRLLDGREIVMLPHLWEYNKNDEVVVTKQQLPLRLAWAMSIHKSQGSSIDYAEIDLGRSIFEVGQAYVALSRVRTLEGLSIINFHEQSLKTHPKVIEFYSKLIPCNHLIKNTIDLISH